MRSDRGQASVELLGIVPAALAALLVVWQLALAGQTLWLAAHAARVAARAHVVGEDPEHAARSALPARLERGLDVKTDGNGVVRVRVAVPFVHPRWAGPAHVSARSSLEVAG